MGNMDTREHRGLAAVALGAVGLVTAAWWVLALYPAASAPEWMVRTRYVCFGAPAGGLPNAGGWILLAGQPVGMLAMLFAGWGHAVRRDLRWLASRFSGQVLLAAAASSVTWGALSAVSVIRGASGTSEPFAANDPTPSSRSIAVPALRLIDQHGQPFDLQNINGGPVLVSFAFAHCATMCPTAIKELLRIRVQAGREDIPLVVVTVDPWRDVPSRLSTIAATWRLAAADRVLSGSIADVNATLDAWNVARVRDGTTGDVVHPLAVVLVHPGGSKATRFDGGFEGLRAMLTGTKTVSE
jgi:cytochrome oxidase Cu insertion factor (SCO1/SenC/PrrC family)